MTISEMDAAISEAKATLSRADMVATQLARLLLGRTRKVESSWILNDLKKELRDWHIGRGWKTK